MMCSRFSALLSMELVSTIKKVARHFDEVVAADRLV